MIERENKDIMHTRTQGIHHIGLTVDKLEASATFFTELLGWREVKRRPDYPAIFVSDGHTMITLWQTQKTATNFNKDVNIGLHHLALLVTEKSTLLAIHETLAQAAVPIEFSPELLGDGPAMHMMCYEPSGIRLEFIWPGMEES